MFPFDRSFIQSIYSLHMYVCNKLPEMAMNSLSFQDQPVVLTGAFQQLLLPSSPFTQAPFYCRVWRQAFHKVVMMGGKFRENLTCYLLPGLP